MAGRGQITIPVAVDTGGVAKAINNGLVEPIEDAEDALKKLERAGDDVDLDRAMDKAERATDDLSDQLDDVRDDLKRVGFAAKDAGDDGATGMGRIRGGAQEVTQEIGQNLGEAVSSIRGDMGDLSQVGQDTLGGLAASVAGMGPAGLLGALALAAGATGLGALTAGLQDAKQKQEDLNEAAANFAQGYQDGVAGALSSAFVFAEINAIVTDPERYEKAKEAAKDWGVDVSTAVGALAGDSDALAIAQESLAARSKEAEEALAQQELQVDSNAGAAYDMADSVDRGRASMEALTGALEQGASQAETGARATYNYATEAGLATGKFDDLGNAIVRLPDGKEVVVNADTETAYADLDTFEQRRIPDKRFNIIASVDTSAWDNFRPRDKAARINYTVNEGRNFGGL